MRQAPGLAVLDWDGTCAPGDLEETWLTLQGLWPVYHRREREEGPVAAYTWAAQECVRGLTESQARARAEDLLRSGLTEHRLALRPEMAWLIDLLRRSGWEIWVVSAAVTPFVQVSARQAAIPPQRVLGVEVARDEAGRFTAGLAEALTYRQGKVEAIRRHIGRAPELAVGDTWTDVEMLDLAGQAVLWSAGDAELEATARQAGWWIQPAG